MFYGSDTIESTHNRVVILYSKYIMSDRFNVEFF